MIELARNRAVWMTFDSYEEFVAARKDIGEAIRESKENSRARERLDILIYIKGLERAISTRERAITRRAVLSLEEKYGKDNVRVVDAILNPSLESFTLRWMAALDVLRRQYEIEPAEAIKLISCFVFDQEVGKLVKHLKNTEKLPGEDRDIFQDV